MEILNVDGLFDGSRYMTLHEALAQYNGVLQLSEQRSIDVIMTKEDDGQFILLTSREEVMVDVEALKRARGIS